MLALSEVAHFVSLVNTCIEYSSDDERHEALLHCDDIVKFVMAGKMPRAYKDKKGETGAAVWECRQSVPGVEFCAPNMASKHHYTHALVFRRIDITHLI